MAATSPRPRSSARRSPPGPKSWALPGSRSTARGANTTAASKPSPTRRAKAVCSSKIRRRRKEFMADEKAAENQSEQPQSARPPSEQAAGPAEPQVEAPAGPAAPAAAPAPAGGAHRGGGGERRGGGGGRGDGRGGG